MENEKVLSYDPKTIELLNRCILEDEFDDELQNQRLFGGKISGEEELKRLLSARSVAEIAQVNNVALNVGSGKSALKEMLKDFRVISLEPNPNRRPEGEVIVGWAENIPLPDKSVGLIVAWSVLPFVRSLQETLVQFNRVLVKNGKLVCDIRSYDDLPIAQTFHPVCFLRYAYVFGFLVEEWIEFNDGYGDRAAYRFRKIRDFDYRWLMWPQCKGKILNYLKERDRVML